jgi:hypothetical protein
MVTLADDGPADFAGVNPAVAYPLAVYARLFGVTIDTARRRVKAGQVKTLPRVGVQPHRVLGAEMIRLAGLEVAPPRTETERQREARGRRAMDDIRRLAKGRA